MVIGEKGQEYESGALLKVALIVSLDPDLFVHSSRNCEVCSSQDKILLPVTVDSASNGISPHFKSAQRKDRYPAVYGPVGQLLLRKAVTPWCAELSL